LRVAVCAALFQESDVTLLHACAKQPNVPLSIPLRLLSLCANPNVVSVVRLSKARCKRPALKHMDVLASAIYHRAWETQIALLTCPQLQFFHCDVQLQWFEDGYADGQEIAGVWPTQQENQAEGERQSEWWSDMLDAAFRYVFLAREYYVQLASCLVLPNDPQSDLATMHEWGGKAGNSIGAKSLLAFVEEKLAALEPRVLNVVLLLVTASFDAAKDYAYERRAGEALSAAEMAKAILERVKVSQNHVRSLSLVHSCRVFGAVTDSEVDCVTLV